MEDLDAMMVYSRRVQNIPLITREREKELSKRIKAGDMAARDELITANLRLVMKIAHSFKGRGLSYQDLVSEGNMGIVRAADKFDPSKGAKFSSYSSWWIRQAMMRAIMNKRSVIRITNTGRTLAAAYEATRRALYEKTHSEPSKEYIARELHLSKRKARCMACGITKIVSMNANIDEDSSTTFADWIEDGSVSPCEKAINDENILLLQKALNILDDDSREIIESRFGMNGRKAATLEELSRKYGCTRENIRIRQKKAIEQIRMLITA